MNKELKKAIIDFMIDNSDNFQLLNTTISKFRNYLYDEKGEFLIGGETVYKFIVNAYELVRF